MGFSLGGLAAACVSAAASCIGGSDGDAPASTLGGGDITTTFTTFSSPAAEHGVEVSAPKPSGP